MDDSALWLAFDEGLSLRWHLFPNVQDYSQVLFENAQRMVAGGTWGDFNSGDTTVLVNLQNVRYWRYGVVTDLADALVPTEQGRLYGQRLRLVDDFSNPTEGEDRSASYWKSSLVGARLYLLTLEIAHLNLRVGAESWYFLRSKDVDLIEVPLATVRLYNRELEHARAGGEPLLTQPLIRRRQMELARVGEEQRAYAAARTKKPGPMNGE